MKIVVLAHPNDNHTAPLKWAAEQAGYQVACWGGLRWNEEQQASIAFREGEVRETLSPFSVEAGDVVWIRRPQPADQNPKVSAVDKSFAEGEYRWFSLSLLYLLETLPVRVVNRYTASRFINNKAVQLLIARQSGLRVPETFMSNSPAAIRAFLEKPGRRAICKQFFPHVWEKNDGGLAVTEAFQISPD